MEAPPARTSGEPHAALASRARLLTYACFRTEERRSHLWLISGSLGEHALAYSVQIPQVTDTRSPSPYCKIKAHGAVRSPFPVDDDPPARQTTRDSLVPLACVASTCLLDAAMTTWTRSTSLDHPVGWVVLDGIDSPLTHPQTDPGARADPRNAWRSDRGLREGAWGKPLLCAPAPCP